MAPAQFVSDLQATLHELGQDYSLDGVDGSPSHLTELCPRCKRVARAGGYYSRTGGSFAR